MSRFTQNINGFGGTWTNTATHLVFCVYFLLLSLYSSCSSVHSWALSWWCILQCSLLLLQYVFRNRNTVYRRLKLFDRMPDYVWGLQICFPGEPYFEYHWNCRKTSTCGSGQRLWDSVSWDRFSKAVFCLRSRSGSDAEGLCGSLGFLPLFLSSCKAVTLEPWSPERKINPGDCFTLPLL